MTLSHTYDNFSDEKWGWTSFRNAHSNRRNLAMFGEVSELFHDSWDRPFRKVVFLGYFCIPRKTTVSPDTGKGTIPQTTFLNVELSSILWANFRLFQHIESRYTNNSDVKRSQVIERDCPKWKPQKRVGRQFRSYLTSLFKRVFTPGCT